MIVNVMIDGASYSLQYQSGDADHPGMAGLPPKKERRKLAPAAPPGRPPPSGPVPGLPRGAPRPTSAGGAGLGGRAPEERAAGPSRDCFDGARSTMSWVGSRPAPPARPADPPPLPPPSASPLRSPRVLTTVLTNPLDAIHPCQ